MSVRLGTPHVSVAIDDGKRILCCADQRREPVRGGLAIGSSATLGTTTSFIGNLIALTSITLNTGADIIGRALARNGAVTLDTNDITFAPCGPGPPPVPTLTTWGVIALVGLLALAGFAARRRRQFVSGRPGL